jgi:hypothetical protein
MSVASFNALQYSSLLLLLCRMAQAVHLKLRGEFEFTSQALFPLKGKTCEAGSHRFRM